MSQKEVTTIKLSKETKKRLDNLKEYQKESYEEIITKILSVLNMVKLNPIEAKKRLALIDRKRDKNSKTS